MTRCLVLGGSGFIGRHLVRDLIERGLETVVGDLVPNPDAPFVMVDYTDESSLKHALDDVEVVIQLAWTSTPQSATDNPIQDVTTNIVGSLNLFRACVAHKVRRVVFCSSGGAIYGISQQLPIVESHPLAPLSSYGITKLAVEKYLFLFSKLYGLEYMIMRPGNAYGEGQVGGPGQGVIAACMTAVRSGQRFTVWGDGSIVRDYVHVSDIAHAISLATTVAASNCTLNIGSGEGLSINDLIAMIRNVTGLAVKVDYTQKRIIDAPINILDSSLAHTTLNWRPGVAIQEGLRRQWLALQGSSYMAPAPAAAQDIADC
jgi:UDP-glucose 4-epimerase